jgi:hypothetical protein
MLLYPILHKVTDQSDQTVLAERTEARPYCRKISLLMPFFQQGNVGEFFTNIVFFPASAAARFLDRSDPPDKPSVERRMLLNAFKGKYRRQMESVFGTWYWRGARWKY